MTFLYFIPELTKQQATAEAIAKAGLDVALRDCLTTDVAFQAKLSISDVRAGPNESSGVLVVALPEAGEAPPIGYYPDQQTWEDEGTFWLGTSNDKPPTPEGLQRAMQVGGYEHELGDGQVWLCPVIRRAMLFATLPKRYARKDGETVATVLPEYEGIWQRSASWAADFASEEPTLTIEERYDACVDCLSLNYRIGPAEAGRLGLLTDLTMMEVLNAALDIPWLIEAQTDIKKKELWDRVQAAMASFSPGQEESTDSTTPAEPTIPCSDSDMEKTKAT